MNKHKSLHLKIFSILFIYFFQFLSLPYAQAQRGIFIREEEEKRENEERGNSFRTVDEKSDKEVRMPAGVGGRGAGLTIPSGREGGEGGTLQLPSISAGGLFYQIHVLGEVKNPGTYRIPASTRLSEALSLAGGIKKNGSERNVEVKRPGVGSVRKVDLLAYKTFGQLEQNPYLMDNEVIFVPLKQKVIEVEGAVNRPAIYELKGEKNMLDVVRLAGGFTQGVSHQESIKIIRYENEKKNIIDVENTSEVMKQTPILDGDVVVIPHIFTTQNTFDYNLKKLPKDNVFYPSFEDRVFVIGSVEVPGAYNFNQHYRLSNYIALAGGVTRMAKGFAKVVSPDGKEQKVKPDSDVLINPGDTVYIPEKLLSRETWISLLTTMASLGLSVTSTAIVLTR